MLARTQYPVCERLGIALLPVMLIVATPGALLAVQAANQLRAGSPVAANALQVGLIALWLAASITLLSFLRSGWHRLYEYAWSSDTLLIMTPFGRTVASIRLNEVRTVLVDHLGPRLHLASAEQRTAIPRYAVIRLITDDPHAKEVRIAPCLECWADILQACRFASWRYSD